MYGKGSPQTLGMRPANELQKKKKVCSECREQKKYTDYHRIITLLTLMKIEQSGYKELIWTRRKWEGSIEEEGKYTRREHREGGR